MNRLSICNNLRDLLSRSFRVRGWMIQAESQLETRSVVNVVEVNQRTCQRTLNDEDSFFFESGNVPTFRVVQNASAQ